MNLSLSNMTELPVQASSGTDLLSWLLMSPHVLYGLGQFYMRFMLLGSMESNVKYPKMDFWAPPLLQGPLFQNEADPKVFTGVSGGGSLKDKPTWNLWTRPYLEKKKACVYVIE